MDTVLIRFYNNGPVVEGGIIWPEGAEVRVTPERAEEIVAGSDGVIITPPPAPPPSVENEDEAPMPATRPNVYVAEHFDDATVGIVIPAFNPSDLLDKCLKSLAVSDAMGISEVVVVDDASDPPIAERAAELMRELGIPGKAVRLDHNQEFARAVNIGANDVAGNHLLMLNVDIEVKPNFLQPMLNELLSDPMIAVVGNMHRLPNGVMDSAGSEWSWTSGTFQHRGRDIKADTTKPAELDMTTWACCLVRRTVWDMLGGLDANTYIAYWEDTDFCMSVRRKGYRVRYIPTSEVVHFGRHSSGKGRDHLSQKSAVSFHRRWVETGKVEGFARSRGHRHDDTRIVIGMITLNEEEYVQAAIESVYAAADLIVVPVGGVEWARMAGMCGDDGAPTDATLDILRAIPDPDHKIKVIGPQLWPDKRDMRNAILAECAEGDLVIMQDADEVWYPDAVWSVFADMRANVRGGNFALAPLREDHWNDLWTLGAGKWEDYREHRVYRFKPGMTYKVHYAPTPSLPLWAAPYPCWAHYAWVKPISKLRAKIDYYRHYPGTSRGLSASYIDDVFLHWRKDPKAVEKRPGTHPSGEGTTKLYERRHPPQIERLILEGKIGREDW